MTAQRYAIAMATLAAAILAGCSNRPYEPAKIIPDTEAAVNPWTNLDVNNDAESFQFAIVSDRTGGNRPGIFASAVEKLNLLQPEFVVCVGDLIQGYTKEHQVIHEQWDEFDGLVDRLDMPFFYVAGNHDITNPVQADIWRERLDRPYYHFRYKDVLFLVLCTEDGKADQITDEQASYFQGVLAEHADAKWTLLFMHKPMWMHDDLSGFAAIEKALADRPYTVFGGHHHTYTKFVRNDRRYIRLATTGGGSGLTGPDYGLVDQIVWVTMTDGGPRLANLLLDGIHDENMMTEATSEFAYGMPDEGIKVAAVIVDGDTLTEATAEMRVTNIVDVPIHFTVTVDAPDGVVVTPAAAETTLGKGKSATVPLKISAAEGVPATGPSDIVLNWSAVADLPDRPGFTISGVTPIGVEPRMTCAAAPTPVTLDGKLDEWPALPLSLASVNEEYESAWSGPDDGSLMFALAYDATHLYVAARATDDEVNSNPAILYWQQDGIEIWLDPRPKDLRLSRRAGGHDRLVVGLRAGATDNELRDGIRGASQITNGGYTAEFAIPLKVLTDRQGEQWDGFRFDIAQFDKDGEAGSQLWWRPPWRSSHNYLGSGPFVRE